ncbi:MAG TPA: phosphoribosylamine--glycine ligase [Patescibacteria group bacterium]
MSRERKEQASVLVVDGGGRGSVLVDAYAKSSHVKKIFAVPGNDLMYLNAHGKPVETYPCLKTTNISDILKICEDKKIDLVDVCQDNAVEAGLVNRLQEMGILTVGPTREAGQIEWDKVWARELGKKIGLPQPEFAVFSLQEEAINFIEKSEDKPRFIKARGLAEGKGALPARNNKEALERIKEISRFGKASDTFIVEDWIFGDGSGEEFSAFAISDGENVAYVGDAQDNKKALNFDEGEYTGGMGDVSSPLVLTPKLIEESKEIFRRAIDKLKEIGRVYKGILYLGGMVVNKVGKVTITIVEWNARWGDPEAQVIIPGILNDLFELSIQVAEGSLKDEIRTNGKVRVAITGASRGYPGDYTWVKGKEIYGINDAQKLEGVTIYSAGIKEVDKKHYANGGRLFYVVGEGKDVIEARARAYEGISRIHVEGNNVHFRTDIGWRDVERIRK